MPSNLQHLLNLVHDDNPTFDADAVDAFIAEWEDSGGSEESNSQPFFVKLFELMGLDFDINKNPDSDRHVSFEEKVCAIPRSTRFCTTCSTTPSAETPSASPPTSPATSPAGSPCSPRTSRRAATTPRRSPNS